MIRYLQNNDPTKSPPLYTHYIYIAHTTILFRRLYAGQMNTVRRSLFTGPSIHDPRPEGKDPYLAIMAFIDIELSSPFFATVYLISSCDLHHCLKIES